VVLLPRDPDASAHRILTKLKIRFGTHIPVIISDTFGRPWRRGLTDVAIGLSGMQAIQDLRGTTDSFGMVLEVTEIAIVDELAAAADLVMGKASGVPAAVVRGYEYPTGSGRAVDLIRPDEEDMFR
jgi:coenzyme F420-0:L-glutamate ligase/coenzyme F420-1:gamma-L-glutamate ligase